MIGLDKQPHISLTRDQVHPVVLVVGDPARAKLLAELCDEHKELAWNREYRSFECTYKKEHFNVVSHGVGCPGAVVCFEELIELGAKIIIRAGTAGSMDPKRIHAGDICIAHSAVREDGTTALLVPAGYPAVANLTVTRALQDAAKEVGLETSTEMALSSDIFYKSQVVPSTLDMWATAKVGIVEMESSALFVLASLKGIKAGGIFFIDGSPFKWDQQGGYTPNEKGAKKELMLRAAITAAAHLTSTQHNN